MSAVVEKKEPAAKFATQVDEQIAQATSRIRVHDLALGGLTLAAMVAVYAATMIPLDKYLNLSESARQLALGGFVGLLGLVGYFLIVRPLRKRVNPLYAAARVEETIDDAKNSITGYVDAQERGDAPAVVKAAMSARAAKAAAEADVNRAVDHRGLLVAGGVLVAFLIALTVLFFVFRPTQFSSLARRAFVPFSSDPIATRTQLTLLKPEPADPTITTGQTVTVAVHVGGKVPSKNASERVRLLIRHNPADANYEELPMQEGDTSRDWSLKVPEYLVQNGFWYKVAAGDAETAEHRVTVRSLPLFTDFEANYEYPKYTRRPPDRSNDANLRAYRGTKITLVARTNREVKDGLMKFEAAGLAPVVGRPVPGKPDSLAFSFTATEATRYRLTMNTATGETNADPPYYHLAIDSDSPPRVEITNPKSEEAPQTAPANGQIALDGTVGDDFGIDKVRLVLKVDGRPLKPVFMNDGKSLRREKDGTWPRDLPDGFKLSADLAKLEFADGAGKYNPKADDQIEFWVEAIDNCSVAKPVEGWGEKPQAGQVGRSEVRKLTVTPPPPEPEAQQRAEQQKNQRRDQERQHRDEQQKKLDAEDRPPPQPDPNKQGQPQETADPKDGDRKEGDPKDGTQKKDAKPEDKKGGEGDKNGKKETTSDAKGGEPTGGTPDAAKDDPTKKDPANPPKADNKKPADDMTDPKKGTAGTDPKAKSADGTEPKADPKTGPKDAKPDTTNPGMPPQGGMGNPGVDRPNDPMPTAPPPKTPEQKNAERDAEKVQNELNRNKGEGGDAKPNPTANAEKDRTPPAGAKPPTAGPPPDMPKEGPKPGDPTGEKGAADAKPQGNLEKKADPDPTPKPQPDANAQPAEHRDAPLGGGNPGQEKPEPKEEPKGKGPNDPKAPKEPKDGKADPKSGSAGKPATQQPESKDAPNPADSAGVPKPNPEPARGTDKTPPVEQKGSQPGDPQPKGDPAAGDGKPDKAPPAATPKPEPKKNGDAGVKGPDASEAKPEPKGPDGRPTDGDTAERRDPPKKAPPPMGGTGGMGDEKAVNPGEDKPPMGGAGDPTAKKDDKKDAKGGGAGKLDEQARKQLEKELQDAARDLDSPDPEKRKQAQDKLDKTIGKDKREEIEKLAKDLKSDDPATKEAAQKKLDELKKQAEEIAKKDGRDGDRDGKKGENQKALSPEEIAELAKKAQDLKSKDEQKRREAEKAFEEKLGKEGLEKLQEELKKQPPDPMDPKQQDDLKKQLDEIAKNTPKGKDPKKDFTTGGGGGSTEPNPEDPADPRNRAKTAQLQLEEFEKNRYNKELQERLGWDQAKMDEFLKAQAERAAQLQKEAEKFDAELRSREPTGGTPTINPGGGGKVEALPTAKSGSGGTSGAGFAPPGFEDARKKFLEAIKPKTDPKP